MKVVHIVTEDFYGAGRAAQRISTALSKKGIESKVYVLFRLGMTDATGFKLSLINRVRGIIGKQLENLELHKYSDRGYFHAEKIGSTFLENEDLINADIIHLHWLNEGIWSHTFIKELIKLNKPIVWTLHDMWPFTGGCHYSGNCEKYKEHCGRCSVLKSDDMKDISYREIAFKHKYFRQADIQFVGCSEWITMEMNESFVGKNLKRKCVNIPNPIENKVFKKMDKEMCRLILDIKTNKKFILFGASSALSDKRKGYEHLVSAIKTLNTNDYCLGVFGNIQRWEDDELKKFETYDFGYISDDFHLALLYNAADIFLAPSLQENLSNTVMEALACETSVVAYKIGGMPDMIISRMNGYLAKPFDDLELAEGIKYCSKIQKKDTFFHINKKFSEEVVAQTYLDLYNDRIK